MLDASVFDELNWDCQPLLIWRFEPLDDGSVVEVVKCLHVWSDNFVHLAVRISDFLQIWLTLVLPSVFLRDVWYALVEQTVEVKVILGQESHGATRKRKEAVLLVAHNEGVYVEVEGRSYIGVLVGRSSLEGADAQLDWQECLDISFGF